jgi:transglutaminase-like putative cysteine protease
MSALWVAGMGSATGESFPDWATRVVEADVTAQFPEADAVVLLDQRDIRVRRGERTGRFRRVVRIRTEAGIDGAKLVVSRNRFRETSRVRLYVHYPDGEVARFDEDDGDLFSFTSRRQLDDTAYLEIRPPYGEPGTVIASEYEFTATDEIPQDLLRLQRDVPVRRAVVNVNVARGGDQRVYARVAGAPNPGPSEVVDQGSWTFENLAGLPHEDEWFVEAPPRITLALGYASDGNAAPFSDWASVSRWVAARYAPMIASRLEVEPEIARATGDIEGSIDGAARRARDLRYFGVEIGWGAWIPRPPQVTLSRGFGDGKDKTVLMAALLRTAGITAVPVLILSRFHGFVHENLPSPFAFNHVVVGIPWSDRDREPGMTIVDAPGIGPLRLVDPTLSSTSGQDLLASLVGARGLAIDPRTTGLLEVQPASPHENYVERTWKLAIDANGDALITLESRAHGAFRAFLEGPAGKMIDGEELSERLLSNCASLGIDPDELDIEGPKRHPDGLWSYQASFVWMDALARFGDLRVLELPPLPLLELLEAVTPVRVSRFLPGSVRQNIRMEALHHRLVLAPSDVELSNPVGSIRTSVEPGEFTTRMSLEFLLRGVEADQERQQEWLRLRKALHRALSPDFVLSPD